VRIYGLFFLLLIAKLYAEQNPVKSSPAQMDFCQGRFAAVERGRLKKGAPILTSYPNAEEIIPLGSGDTGSVYRIKPKGGKKEFIVKLYHEEQSLSHDLVALLFLRTRVSKTGFKVPAVKRGKVPNSLEMEDVRGLSLDKALKTPGLPAGDRKKLTNLYLDNVETLVESIKSSPDLEVQFEKWHISDPLKVSLEVLDKRSGVRVSYLIKPSGVIVDPKNFAMTFSDAE
jgi:hypothetical protein